jgi:hypothetical protein
VVTVGRAVRSVEPACPSCGRPLPAIPVELLPGAVARGHLTVRLVVADDAIDDAWIAAFRAGHPGCLPAPGGER